MVLEKRFLNVVNVFSLFHFYLPLEKGLVFYLNTTKSPSPLKSFVPILVETGTVILEKSMKNVKSLRQRRQKWRRTTDKAHQSLLLPLTNLNFVPYETFVIRISAFKTWWKNQKIWKSKFCSLFGPNVFFNVFTLIWKNTNVQNWILI